LFILNGLNHVEQISRKCRLHTHSLCRQGANTMPDHILLISLCCVLIAVIAALVGAAAFYLARCDHHSYPAALARAAIAFAATLTLASAIACALAAVATLTS
jgi:hypothetical protein